MPASSPRGAPAAEHFVGVLSLFEVVCGEVLPAFRALLPVVPARRAYGLAVGVDEEVGRGPLVQPPAPAAGVAEPRGAAAAEGPARRRAARVRRRYGRAALVAARVEALRALRADPLDAALLRRVVPSAVSAEVEKGFDVGWGRVSSPWHFFTPPFRRAWRRSRARRGAGRMSFAVICCCQGARPLGGVECCEQ